MIILYWMVKKMVMNPIIPTDGGDPSGRSKLKGK